MKQIKNRTIDQLYISGDGFSLFHMTINFQIIDYLSVLSIFIYKLEILIWEKDREKIQENLFI